MVCTVHFSAAAFGMRNRTLVLLAVCAASCISAQGQADPAVSAPATPKALSYDVISIRPNNSADQSSSWRNSSNGIVLTNAPLSWLVRNAFNIITDDQLAGLPGWVDSDRYDIQAKMDDESAASWKNMTRQEKASQQRLLLQSLLVNRCQLKFHRETKQLPVYDLVIAKGGLKIKEAAAEQGARTMTGPGQFTGQSVTLESLVNNLSNEVGRFTIDKTGLGDKKFDITLKWTPDDQRGTAEAGPSIFSALEEQLGLKLVSSKGPVDVVVIDRMEKPEAN
jgi:uncharacterized protein (TIGR03435 family)